MKINNTKFILLIVILTSQFISCEENYTPKPRGFFRINLPDKTYKEFNPDGCAYKFKIPEYAKAVNDESANKENCWYNIEFPYFKGTVYLSYKNFKTIAELKKLCSDGRDMVMKHISKASGMIEENYNDEQRKVYATLFTLKGNTASQMQFYITDSINNYLRGSLYFYTVPHADSIAPVNAFVQADIKYMIASLEWK